MQEAPERGENGSINLAISSNMPLIQISPLNLCQLSLQEPQQNASVTY